jgi:hypothetical protein
MIKNRFIQFLTALYNIIEIDIDIDINLTNHCSFGEPEEAYLEYISFSVVRSCAQPTTKICI